MTIGSTQDRRQFIQDKLATLREIATYVLGFSPVNEASVKTGGTNLSETGSVIGKLTNDYGPDYTAMHFDLSTGGKTRQAPNVSNLRWTPSVGQD